MTFREADKAIRKEGWMLESINGSHHHYEHRAKPGKVAIPNHSGRLPQRVINSINKQSGTK